MSGRATASPGARIEVVDPRGSDFEADETIPFRFNPTEYRVNRGHRFTEKETAGQSSPTAQPVSGKATSLSMTVLFDTSDTKADVRSEYTDDLRKLLEVSTPPILRVAWGSLSFVGVLESANTTYTMFRSDGRPIRARSELRFRRHMPESGSAEETEGGKTKSRTVKEGDTLSGIAAEEYGEPGKWRKIAAANGIGNPRSLQPGRELTIPPLEGS